MFEIMQGPPLCAGWPSLVLAHGRPLYTRPLEPFDREEVRRLFARLSADSRFQRFHGSKPELTERDLDALTQIDHVTHEALAVFDARDASLVAVARYVRLRDRPDVAEVAAEVVDELHDLGIGSIAGEALIDRARANGVRTLIATVLWENQAARALLRRLGFRTRRSAGPTIEAELVL